MKSEIERIENEINSTIQRELDAEAARSRQEQDARNRYTTAQANMAAALEAGDREAYTAAGMLPG